MEAKQVQYKKTGLLAIKIDPGLNRKLIAVLQLIPKCKRHPAGYWTCPLSYKNVEVLDKHKVKLCPKLQEYLFGKPKEVKLQKVKIKGLKGKLRPYQNQGVSFLETMGGKGLIADEMGLGKTIQAIAYMQLHPELRPAIVIVPGCVKYKWEREIIKWMCKPGQIQILQGQSADEKINGDIIIANYDILHYWRTKLYKAGFKTVIIDEVQYIKNNTAKRTNVVIRLGKKAKAVIGLSGTPIENRPIELYNFIRICKPKLFKDRFSFGLEYCGAYNGQYGWNFNGASNTIKLNKLLREHIMIRRLKKDVLKELPEIQYNVIPLSLSNAKDYDRAKTDFIEFVKETKGIKAASAAERAQTLAQLAELKKLAAIGKYQEAIQWIDDFLETGQKLVVAYWHKEIGNMFMSKYGTIAVKIDGSVSNKDKIAQQFQTSKKIKIAFVNMKAGGVGLDLFAASNMVIFEYPWSPSLIAQVIARIHRIGQTSNKVSAHYMVGIDSIDDKLVQILDKKQNIITQVMDGKNVHEEYLISELIDNIMN